MTVQTLAALRRYLQSEGATVEMTRYEVWRGEEWVEQPLRDGVKGPRVVAQALAGSALLRHPNGMESWLVLGPASEWEFGGDVATWQGVGVRVTYRWGVTA